LAKIELSWKHIGINYIGEPMGSIFVLLFWGMFNVSKKLVVGQSKWLIKKKQGCNPQLGS
jgi:hypothetical protein